MKITWFGHSAFRVETGGAVILIDPFIPNPSFKGDVASAWQGATHIVLTHGHDDHVGNTVEIGRATGALVICNPEIADYLGGHGLKNFSPCNMGGTVDHGAFSTSLVPAFHSSSTFVDGRLIYLGNPAGAVITPKGDKVLYHMGDTDIFSDMSLINEIHAPKIGMIPVGDRFTMGGKLAAMACRKYFDFDVAIPMHYGTFPIIDATADKFVEAMKGGRTKVLVPEIGKSVEV